MKESGNFKGAIEQYEIVRRISHDLENRPEETHALMLLGVLNWNLGKVNDSFDNFKEAQALASQSNLKEEERYCSAIMELHAFFSKGMDNRSSGKFKDSITYFEKAVDLARQIGSLDHEAKCLRQESLSHWELSDIEEYLKLNIRALRLMKSTKNRREEGICNNNIGLYYWKHYDYSKALKYFQLGINLADEQNDPENKANGLANICLIYSAFGDYEKALEYSNKVLKIDKELQNNYYIAAELNNIGNIYLNYGMLNYGMQKKGEELFGYALASYTESLSIAYKINNVKISCTILNNIGELCFTERNYYLALDYYSKSLEKANEINDLELISQLNNNIGNVNLAVNSFKKGVEYYIRAIELARKIKAGKILWEAYFGLGQCYEKEGNYLRALESYEKSIDVIDKIRSQINLDTFKAGYVRNKSKVYERLIDLLLKMKTERNPFARDDEVFYFVERAKARAFLECLAESRIDVQQSLSEEQRAELSGSSGRISALFFDLAKTENLKQSRAAIREKIVQEEDNYVRLISKIRTDNPAITSLVSPEPCQLKKIQDELEDDKTALVEYFLGDVRSLAIVITKNSLGISPLPSRLEIENSLRAYLKYLSLPPETEFDARTAARRICDELLFGLKRPEYQNIEKLIVVPDGILYYLPFEALAYEEIGHRLHYLVERYQVSYAPSASVYAFLNAERREQTILKGLLAFGDPEYPNEMANRNSKLDAGFWAESYINGGFVFSPIPNSRREVRKISKYFPRDQREIYLGKDAREDILKTSKSKNYQIIHFACHSFLDQEHPVRSALVLSQNHENGEDGFLQVRELYNLRLNANLIILSACQTGRGTLEKNEGILGLPRIFFYAGADSVVSTLWPIGDESTAVFMEKLYRNLSSGCSKATALALTKREMLRSKYSFPYYWAGYILSGESRSRIIFH